METEIRNEIKEEKGEMLECRTYFWIDRRRYWYSRRKGHLFGRIKRPSKPVSVHDCYI